MKINAIQLNIRKGKTMFKSFFNTVKAVERYLIQLSLSPVRVELCLRDSLQAIKKNKK